MAFPSIEATTAAGEAWEESLLRLRGLAFCSSSSAFTLRERLEILGTASELGAAACLRGGAAGGDDDEDDDDDDKDER